VLSGFGVLEKRAPVGAPCWVGRGVAVGEGAREKGELRSAIKKGGVKGARVASGLDEIVRPLAEVNAAVRFVFRLRKCPSGFASPPGQEQKRIVYGNCWYTLGVAKKVTK